MRKTPCMIAALIAWPTLSWGQVTSFNVETRLGTLSDNTQVVANVLSLDFASTYSGSQLLVQLNSGSIYNEPTAGSDGAPNPAFIGVFPDLDFDTFVANGSRYADENQASAYNTQGGVSRWVTDIPPGDLNHPTSINQNWQPVAGTSIVQGEGFVVAQLTFSPDANGYFAYNAAVRSDHYVSQYFEDYQVLNGRIVTTIEGDYDSSGQVGQGDLDFILQNWGRDIDTQGVPEGWVQGLPTGQVSQNELDAVLTNWGRTNAPDLTGFSGGSVPEPASAALLGASLLTLRRRSA